MARGRGSSLERKRMRRSLRERDGENCCWCGERMIFPDDPHWSPRDRKIATFEHLQPVRLGGTFAAYNLKLAHSRCNAKRDTDPTPEQLSQWTERA